MNGCRLGRQILREVPTLVTPDTILRWHRLFIAHQGLDDRLIAPERLALPGLNGPVRYPSAWANSSAATTEPRDPFDRISG